MASLSISKLVLHALWLIPLHLTRTSASACPPKDPFDWDSITPAEHISWVPCYNATLCARLQVPLDYAHPEGDKLAIALLKVPANVSTSDPTYRGSLFINPGGPGFSAVDVILELGTVAQTIIGANFDIIGFDSRGIGRTTPGIDSFRGADLQKQVWGIRHLDVPTVSDSVEAIPRAVALRNLTNRLLADRAANIAPYVGTAAVARDMLSIIDALGQDKLQYWGTSYGSVLGMTFASLFPDKVGRLVVDGIVDFNAWYKGDITGDFQDTDSIISIVASQCAATTACPLHEATPEAVEKRLFNIFESLRTKVVTLYDGVENLVYIDRKLALSTLWVALYYPYISIAPVFDALADLEKGDGHKLYKIIGNLTVTCQDCHQLTVANAGASPDADISIQCADSGATPDDLAFLKNTYDTLSASTRMADVVFPGSLRCVQWSLESKSRFEGTLGGNTSFPLLFIGNTHDTITPLQNALNMSPLFNGSVVLTRNAIGHTSLSGTSMCTFKAARDYLQDGVLPEPGTICDDIIETVFGNQTAPTKRGLSDDDVKGQILEAAKALSWAKLSRVF